MSTARSVKCSGCAIFRQSFDSGAHAVCSEHASVVQGVVWVQRERVCRCANGARRKRSEQRMDAGGCSAARKWRGNGRRCRRRSLKHHPWYYIAKEEEQSLHIPISPFPHIHLSVACVDLAGLSAAAHGPPWHTSQSAVLRGMSDAVLGLLIPRGWELRRHRPYLFSICSGNIHETTASRARDEQWS